MTRDRSATDLLGAGVLFVAAGCSSHAGASPVDAGARAMEAGPTIDAGKLADSAAHQAHDAGDEAPPSGGGSGTPQPQATRGSGNGLHANGGRIVLGDGRPVNLYGVNRAGTEYACVQGYGIFDGPSDAASILAMKSWGVNAVRVPMNEDCWLSLNGVSPTYSGTAYQTAITGYVQLLLTNGMYPIVDLHWTAPGSTLATGQQPMPDMDHSVDFGTQVASAFKSDTDVVFELFNEPWPDNNQDTDDAWTCWQNGGTCASISYPVAGMQTLVDAVRGAGATNLVLLGGVEYSNALSQWAAHIPTDPLHNLAAAWHVYPGNTCDTSSCWDSIEGTLSASYPIVATEVGDDQCDGVFPTSVMTWLDGHEQSYLAWTWDTFGADCSHYSLITDYDGTPNGAYGTAWKTHLALVNP